MADSESALALRIVISFVCGMLIIFATASMIGSERKAAWFRKRQKYSFFNRRGFVGDVLHFGYPCTWEGVAVALFMFGAVGLVGFLIIFVV